MIDAETRLIYAETLAEEIESLNITVSGKPASWDVAKTTVLQLIAEQPTVDAVPVEYAGWEPDGIARRCRTCGRDIAVEQGTAEMNYCPHCGRGWEKKSERREEHEGVTPECRRPMESGN